MAKKENNVATIDKVEGNTREELKKRIMAEEAKERKEATTVVVDFQEKDTTIKKLLGELFKKVKDTKKSVYIRETGYQDIDSFRIKYEACEWNDEGDTVVFQDMLGVCPKTLSRFGKNNTNRFPQARMAANQMFQAIVDDH